MNNILIDLSILKNPNCGLGQVALNYGYYFRDEYVPEEGECVTLMVPRGFMGKFGERVRYVESKKIYRVMPFLIQLKPFDVWHAIHQLSRYKPYARKYVLTVHDFNFCYEKSGGKVDKYLRKVGGKVRRADVLAAISQFAESEIRRYTPTEKEIHIIYNGIERIEQLPERRPEGVEKPFLFTIGEVKEKKNFHVLLDVMKLLPEYQLYIAGNDKTEYAEMIKRRIEAEGIKNVRLMGLVSGEEKCWMYRNCEAFVFPSLFEGFGLPVVEAMLFKKPVVSSDKTSLGEICDGHARFLPGDFGAEESARIIREAIKEMSSEELERAYEYATSFSWKRHVEEYLKLYRGRRR